MAKNNKLTRKMKKAQAAQTPEIKRVSEMTVGEVLKTKLFQDNLRRLLNELQTTRENAKRRLINPGEKLCSHPIDKLIEKGVFEPGNFTVAYAQICDKKAVGYSANERSFISSIGTEAFNKTMKTLIEDEKKRDNGNGND